MKRRVWTGSVARMIPLLMACLVLAGSPAQAQGAVSGPTELVPPSRSANNLFGRTLDLSADGNTAVVIEGCLGFGLGFGGKGCVAHVFARSGESWIWETTITPPLRGNDSVNGVALSAAGDLLLIGLNSYACGSLDCGAAFLYARTPQGWSEIQKLSSSAGGDSTYFGVSVALSPDGDTVVVSDILEGCCGAVYVFKRSGGSWTERQKLHPPDPIGNDPSLPM